MSERIIPVAATGLLVAVLSACGGAPTPTAAKPGPTAEVSVPSPKILSYNTNGALAYLAWAAPAGDVELTGYDVYVDQDRPVRLEAQRTSFTSLPLAAGATHFLQVVALAGERVSVPSTATVDMLRPATSQQPAVDSIPAVGTNKEVASGTPGLTAWCAIARQSAENLTAFRRHRAASSTAGDAVSRYDTAGRLAAEIAELKKAAAFGDKAQADLGRLGTMAPSVLAHAFDVVRNVSADSVVLSDRAELSTSKLDIVNFSASTCDTVLDLQGLLDL